MKEEIERYKDFVRPYYANRDIAHNFSHIERIIGRLDRLSEGIPSPPRRDHLCFLACFHGLSHRLSEDQPFRQQAIGFLRSLGWTETEIPDLFKSLERHLQSPQTVEEEIVHDANKIEVLGAFGIAKAFTMGGVLGQSYTETADYYEHQSLGKAVFRTPVGKQIAEEGRVYALAFLERFREELT